MINLSKPFSSLHLVHRASSDPGREWIRDANFVVDAAPDDAVDPPPEARWPASAARTGVCGAVSPRVVALPTGGYRLYYSQMLSRPGFPDGALDYDNCRTRILSTFSPDGVTWNPEPGVRLSPQQCGGDVRRVVSSEVVPVAVGDHRLRMYFESCSGLQSEPSSIRSAISEDGGLTWTVEPGHRIGDDKNNFMSPRILFLDDGRCRLYCCQRDVGIVSAISEDGGLTFEHEPGVRVGMDTEYDALVAFACEIMTLENGMYLMYYAGYGDMSKSHILRAVSEDALTWYKEEEPIMSPGEGKWDAAKCSEVCIYHMPMQNGMGSHYGMVYEACDGTGRNVRGVWRVAGAKSAR
ncbi:MAG: exo-alpha-sialidase [Planctomycetaceae bacterium]